MIAPRLMPSLQRLQFLLWAVALASAVTSCGILGPDLSERAEIEFQDIEGGCWFVVTAERAYEPWNLPEEFRVAGLAVRVEGDLIWEGGSFCTGPPYLDIHRIEQVK